MAAGVGTRHLRQPAVALRIQTGTVGIKTNTDAQRPPGPGRPPGVGRQELPEDLSVRNQMEFGHLPGVSRKFRGQWARGFSIRGQCQHTKMRDQTPHPVP